MPSDRVMEQQDSLDERIAAAFAKPTSSGQLVPLPQTNVAISDSVITAQKVDVERDEAKVLGKIKVMAQAAGEDWYYRYPTKNRDGSTGWIEGPSIKCANNVARYYGNCQVDTRVVDNGDSWIIYARFVDYETGFSYTRPFQQRKNQRAINAKDGDRLLDIALQIGVSKAIRNVVCNAIETFTTFAFDEAKSAIVGKIGQRLDFYRDRITQRLGELKIEAGRVEATTGRAVKDWLAPDMARIIAQLQAIGDGMASADETWPPLTGDAAPPRPTREEFAGNGAAKAEPTTEAHAETPGPYEIYDVTGVAVEKMELDAAVGAYRAFLIQGERQQGEAGLTTVWDNNQGLMQQLDERGHEDLSKELSREYGEARQAAAARAQANAEREAKAAAAKETDEIPRGTETEVRGPSAADHPERASVAGAAQGAPSTTPTPAATGGAGTSDLLGGTPAEDLTIPLTGKKLADFEYFARQLAALIAEAPGTDTNRLTRIRLANERGLAALKAGAPTLYEQAMAALYRKP